MRISNFKLGVAVPLSFPLVHAAFFDSFVTMKKPEWLYFRASNGPIEELRNQIVRDARAASCSHLLFMDTDQVYHPETIPRLLAHNLPVVGALVYRRYPPFDPLMYRGKINEYQTIRDWEPDSLVEVDATGTGCILYQMSVFDALPDPWFHFRQTIKDGTERTVGEDIGFCSDLKAAGFKIFVDTSVPAGHLTMLEVTEGTWKLYRRMKEAELKANSVEHHVLKTEKT